MTQDQLRSRTRFPALRCMMGDWIYYATFLRFVDVAEWVKPTKEVHRNPRLSERIQRQLKTKHAKEISAYLRHEEQRFFNALVIGVYGGEPQFGPMDVVIGAETGWSPLTEAEEAEVESSVGLLQLSGEEDLFAIDGQHRVAGIKRALKEDPSLSGEEITVLFVGHQKSEQGLARTRRLFTTLNKTAKRVSTADIVLLDEDNSFAITVRRVVNDYDPFCEGRLVKFTGAGAAIPASNQADITSIIALYEMIQDLYGPKGPSGSSDTKGVLKRNRASDEDLDRLYDLTVSFWDALQETYLELGDVVKGRRTAGDLRRKEVNHFLARPAGQRVMASATHVLLSRGHRVEEAIELLNVAPSSLLADEWRHLLWDPVNGRMITTAKNRALAETFLLTRAGLEARSDTLKSKYREFLRMREELDGADT